MFASIPYGAHKDRYPINPYLIAGCVTDDAVIAYHTALMFSGVAYSISYRIIYLTMHHSQAFRFREETYLSTSFPEVLCSQDKQNVYVNTEDVQGLDIRVTNLERTMVDVMGRPLLGGGWEEIWRSLNMIEQVNLDQVVDYALLLNNATTIAKVGFYLETRQADLNVTSKHLNQLQKYIPVSPHYLGDLDRESYQLNKRWNIMVPKSLVEQSWEESLEEEIFDEDFT